MPRFETENFVFDVDLDNKVLAVTQVERDSEGLVTGSHTLTSEISEKDLLEASVFFHQTWMLKQNPTKVVG